MERLAAKKKKGILSRMPKESNEDILVGLKKAEIKSREEGKRKATAADAESVREELELANAKDELDARKPAGKLKARPDIKLEGLKSSTDIVQEAKKKEADTGDLATIQNIMREHRREEALQNPESLTPAVREAMQEHMKEEGDRYRAALQPKKGFEAQYDADVKFQEEEYGGGSLERDRMLAEIMGQEYQTDPDPVGVEGTITDRDLYEKYYAEAKEKNPSAQKEQLQDAAIKGVMADQAERAALDVDKFPESLEGEATETVGAGLGYEKTLEELRQEKADREAAAKKKENDQGKAAAETAKKTGPGGADTRRQPTAAELAARKALTYDPETGTFSRDGRAIPQAKVIEDSVDETTTEKSIEEDEEEAEKITELAVRDSTAKEAFDAGFANVRMPGLRKQSSELYNSFDKAYSSMYPSQEEMNQYSGARGRLIKRRNALDTVKNKLFRSSPDQWGNRPYGIGMNLDDAIQVLENELPTATKEIKEMARRMRGFHILMNRYGEDAQLKGASDLENLLRNTRLRGDKPPEESPSEDLIASAAGE